MGAGEGGTKGKGQDGGKGGGKGTLAGDKGQGNGKAGRGREGKGQGESRPSAAGCLGPRFHLQQYSDHPTGNPEEETPAGGSEHHSEPNLRHSGRRATV